MHVDRAARDAGTFEHVPQRHAAPSRDADRAQPPLRAGRRRPLLAGEEAAAVARTLDERGPGRRRQPPAARVGPSSIPSGRRSPEPNTCSRQRAGSISGVAVWLRTKNRSAAVR